MTRQRKPRIVDGMYAEGGSFMTNGGFSSAANAGAGIIEGLDQGTAYGRKRVGSSIASGALSGAATGAAIGGPWGAVIGGVVGGAAGWISGGAAKRKEAKMVNGLNMQRDARLRAQSAAKLNADPSLVGGYGNRGYYARGGSMRSTLPTSAGESALADYVRDVNPWLLEGAMQSDALDGRLNLAYGGPIGGGMVSDTTSRQVLPMTQEQLLGNAQRAYVNNRANTVDSLSKAWNVPSRDIMIQSAWNYGDSPTKGGIPRNTSYEYKGGTPQVRRMIDYYPGVIRGSNAYVKHAHGGLLGKAMGTL